MNNPLTPRGWATVFAFLILLDDVTDLIDEPNTGHAVLFVADLIVIVLMVLALYVKQPAKERKG